MTRAAALLARILDDLPRAAAAAARTRGHEVAERRALRLLHLPRAVAVGTRLGLRALGCARTVTCVTILRARNRQLDLLAERRFLKGNLQVIAQVVARLRAFRPATATAAAEEGVHDVVHAEAAHAAAKAAEAAAETAEAPCASCTAARTVKRRVAKLIVRRFLLRIGEDLIGLVDLLELLGSFLRIVTVQIGMVLARHLLERLLDVSIRSAFGEAEHLIVIAFLAHNKHLTAPSAPVLYRQKSAEHELHAPHSPSLLALISCRP